jgi:ribosomal protection tetracycline resistance protein
MPFLNLGVVAHVDAGKTTLTERLLFETGVSSQVGRVDHGDTVTDADTIERRRGITIRSAVVTFTAGDTTVNLIDTPGHSDFVAEVERALAVLDGTVLVVSAVEGVQAQTRVLVRVLEALGIPFVVFANKVDRVAADAERTLAALRESVSGAVVPLAVPERTGSRAATVRRRPVTEVVAAVADVDGDLLRRYVDGPPPGDAEVRAALARQTAAGRLHPVLFGAALTGVGVRDVLDAVPLLRPAAAREDAGLHAGIFKIDRDDLGHRVAYARLFAGSLATRDEVQRFHRNADGDVVTTVVRPTGVRTFSHGATTADRPARAGEIAQVVGLGNVEIGDQLGRWDDRRGGRHFAPPGLESVVRPRDPADATALFEALRVLSAQDPLIDARLDGVDAEPTVSLYGEVQKEVLATRLATEFGIDAEFLATQVVHVERVSGTGEAVDTVPTGNATVGLRIAPAPPGSGIGYGLAVEKGWLLPAYHAAIEETIASELRHGLYGWAVADAAVTLVASRYCAPTPPAGYFRQLAASTLRRALVQAGTVVCAPVSAFEVGFPTAALRPVLQELIAAGATPDPPETGERRSRVTGVLPTARVHDVEARLPDLTGGEGYLVARPAGYEPMSGPPLTRRSPAG